MCFELVNEYLLGRTAVRNYVGEDRQFINLFIRRANWVRVETTHPNLHSLVVGSVDEAIAAIKELGWEVA